MEIIGGMLIGNSTGTILYRGNFDLLDNLYTIYNTTGSSNKLKAYRIAIAKERNNLYKSLEYDTNYGWEIINVNENGSSGTISINSNESISQIYRIDITFSDLEKASTVYYTDTLNITLNGTGNTYSSDVISVSLGSDTTTREFSISDSNNTSKLS